MVKIERWILLYLMDKLGHVPRWMPLLSETASGYDETGTGASVDAFALGDRQCIDRLLGWVPRWCLCSRGPPVTYWIKSDYGWCLGGCLCSRGPVVFWIKKAWWLLEIGGLGFYQFSLKLLFSLYYLLTRFKKVLIKDFKINMCFIKLIHLWV